MNSPSPKFPRSLPRRGAGILSVLGCLLMLTGGLRAEFDPVLVKVMEKAEIFGDKPFEGDVAVNAHGQWIAASQNGVFLSLGGPTSWQEVLTAGGQKIVNANTLKIQCRISDTGSWVVINRAGIYKNTTAPTPSSEHG